MPKRRLIRSVEYPYHLYARMNNRENWPVPIETAWAIFKEVHNETVSLYSFDSHTFVLMHNHYHWICSTPEGNIDFGMRYFQGQASKRIAKEAHRINRIFGGNYKSSLLKNEHAYQRTYRYVHMNPVRAGICALPTVYPWSTLVAADWIMCSPLGFSAGMPPSLEEQSSWMLQLRESDDEERTRLALRRAIFKIPRARSGYMK